MDPKIKQKLKQQKPFNLSLLNLNQDNIYKLLGKVTSTNMFDGANYHLHPEGLWSNELFGAMGNPDRMKKQAYMDLNLPILHPLVYRELISASSLLDGIMAGTEYAIFNPNTQFFERSNAIDGKTGYAFFFNHVDEMKLPDTGTSKRQETIKLLEKNKHLFKIDKFIILQAGYRDIEFNEGQINHDEINQIYRELLSLANSVSIGSHKNNIELVNSTRYAMQKTALKLFMYLGEITGHGKKKLVQGKWASRNVFNGTSNVITAPLPSGRLINDERNLGYNGIMVGLFQQMVACLPFAVRAIKNSFLADKFHNPLEPVILANRKTFKEERINLSNEWFDLFQSEEGIKKLIQRFRPVSNRHKAIEIDGHYLALIYKGTDGTFKILNSIEELPNDKDRSLVTPISFIELLYICTCHAIDGTPAFATRYPITGIGSNVPGKTHLMTTTKAEIRRQLDDDWQIDETIPAFLQFPIHDKDVISSMAPPTASMSGMGGDYDGDRNNMIAALTQEARNEIIQYKKEKRAYIGPDGSIRYSLDYDTIKFVCYNLSTFEEEV